MSVRGLGTPEYTVLGIVQREGPCTTYHVMKVLGNSPSSFYRKRASSTYSLVEKLTKRGLLRPVEGDAGPRKDRPIEVTPAGIECLHGWLVHVPELEVAYSNDLVRLRVSFWNLMSREEQVNFVHTSLESLRKLLAEQKAAFKKLAPEANTYPFRGIIHETKARIAWLEEMRDELKT